MATTRICTSCSEPLAADAPRGLCPGCLLKVGFGPVSASTPPPENPVFHRPLEVPPTPSELARHFPQFEIMALRGQGGMGMVYQARQSNLDRFVALKLLPPSYGHTAEFAQRFEREAKALARLNHPNIISVHDMGRAGPFYYFSMEFVDGRSLAELERSRRLTPGEAVEIVSQVCDGLQFAHEEGVVHRDVKPANILLDSKGHVKLGDFGVAKILDLQVPDPKLTVTGMRMGTPRYMAPEQVDAPESVDHRADVFSLGVVFYEMLTGELPVGRFSPPSQFPGVDRRLDEVIYRLLEREPARRYQQAGEVRTDLEIITRGGSRRGGASARARGKPGWLGWTLIAVASVLALGSGAWWLLLDRSPVASLAISPARVERTTMGETEKSSVPGWVVEARNPADYNARIDREVRLKGKPSLFLNCTYSKQDGIGALVQAIRADDYRGKRVRFSGQLRARDVTGWAGLCMRVEAYGNVQTDDMERRDVTGTADWKKSEIVLDVPSTSDRILFGLQLTGSGGVWLNDLEFEMVGMDVPTTGRKLSDTLPGAPQLEFDK